MMNKEQNLLTAYRNGYDIWNSCVLFLLAVVQI